jgi:hypothetical protein
MTLSRLVIALIALLGLAVAACQEVTTDNFINPPPGVPDTCTTIAALPGCDQGSLSYACTSDRPDDVGSAAGHGDVQQLACSAGSPGPNGSTLYCCAPWSSYFSGCAVDTKVPGCGATSFGLSCASGISPSDADPSIACGAAIPGANGAHRYCCNTAAVPQTCAPDPSVAACTGVQVGYGCVSGATPSDGDASLACSAETRTADGSVGYCCVPFAQTAATCRSDATVACASGAYAFACQPGASPDALDPALACTPSTTPGGACCTVTSS